MEVHAHTHTPGKKFTHYLWEFLMLFLAVFCGFLAENYREKLVRKEKENHYIESMVRDIKKDIGDLDGILVTQEYLLGKMDSALSVPVTKLTDINIQDTFFHHFFYFYSWISTFTQNDNAWVQLKNAGGFSTIRQQDVIDSITLLYGMYERYVKINAVYYIDYYNKTVQLATQMMDLPAIPSNPNHALYQETPRDIEVFTRYDLPLLKQLYSTIRYDRGCLVFYMIQEKEYLELAKKTLGFLVKKYNLKNE